MKKILFLLFIFNGLISLSQPLNDNPCNAIPLPMGNTCTQTDANNFGATASAGVPAPGCGTPAYSGGDVWFSAVCPASGTFSVMMTFAGLDNVALAMYSGGCSALTLVSCDYDGIGAANMPEIFGTGLTPGATYYFRAWNPPNNTTGAISICAIATSTAVLAPNNQDCLNAIPVCQSTFTTTTAYSGTGNIGSEINAANSCLGGEKNDVWYQFTVQNSGSFCFAIDPINNSNDYDWALYNLTGASCSDIYSNAALEVSCNFSPGTSWTGAFPPSWVVSGGSTGTTGMFPNAGSGSTLAQNKPCIAVTAGQSFALNISAFTTSASGFYLNFPPPGTFGMAVIYDIIPPAMQAPQAYPSCGGNQLFVTFSENIKCSSVSSNDFSISGPGGPYTISNQIGSACSGGGLYENSFVLSFSPPLLKTGTYTVCMNSGAAGSVLDACNNAAATGCFTFAITAPSITAVPANLNCNGVPTGSIVATGAGSASFNYQLNGGTQQTSGTYTGLSAGTYTVNAIALSGCPASTVVTITQPPALTLTALASPSVCAPTGSASSVVSGGTSAYSYSWSPSGGTSSTATGLTTGTYTVKVTDFKGCIKTATTSVIANPTPSATVTFTNPTCGINNGIIIINNTSGAGQTISSFASSLGSISGQTVTGLGAGTPVITLTNNFGCTFTVSATLTMTPGPTNAVVTPTNATCGNNNGSIAFGAPTGGTPTYSYAINGGAFIAASPTINLPVGTYSVTVKDANGCVFTKTTSIINIPGPTAIAGTTTQASCNTNNGTFSVTGVTGGTSAYTYSLNGVSTTSLTSGLAAGTHTILVRDANGCTFSRTFAIGTANGPSSFTVTSTNSNCGLANGSATVSGVVGGTPTYSFSFDGGAFTIGTTVTGLTATTHTVIVKDVNSCTIAATYVVSNNAPPTASVTNSVNILCNGGSNGSFTATPVGNGPFTYTLVSPAQSNSTGVFTALPAGTYSVIIKDVFGCTTTTSVTLTQPTVVTATVSSIPVNCFGNSTGSVSAGASGGTGPYTYLWPALGSSTLATTGGAAAGTYTVTIKDANLCTITRTVIVTQPTSLTLTSTLTPATCGNANGSGTVTVGGGSPGYSYNWSNGGLTNVLTSAAAGTYTITAQDLNGCIITNTVTVTNIPGPTAITGTTTLAGCGLNNGTHNVTGVTGGTSAYTYSVDGVGTPSLTTGLASGTHTLTVKDFNGCLFSTTFNINTASGPTTATVVTTNASCGTANGSATVTAVTGGLSPYQYSFDGGAFGAAAITSGIAAGSHTVVIRDANSCTLTVTYTEFNNSGPTASVTNSVNILCNGNSTGSFTVAPTGGIGPFTYTLATPTQTNTTGIFSSLPAGSYNVTVRDNSGCTATASVTLTQPTAVTLTVTALPANCFGASTGTVSASGGGGAGTLTYLWPALGSNTLATVNNVAAGTYSVTQTDANGCSITQAVTVTQPTSLTLTSTLTAATCGNANGSATVTVGGGTPAYTYNWSNGAIISLLSGASGGTYTLNVTDFKGCLITRTLTVTNIAGPTALTGTTTLTGCGLSNGTYNVTGVTGGTSAYSFSVDAVSTASLTSGLAAGTHTVAVSDFNGCIFSTTFNINTATGPTTASIVTTNATCGSANGSATVVTVTGGLAPYQYSFDGGSFAVGSSTTGLIAGTHTLTIQDANSCTLTVTYNVLNNGSPVASVLTSTNTSCFAGTNGGFTIGGSGGSGGPFTYTLTSPFQNNGTMPVFTGLASGTYSVIVGDNVGCTASTTVTVLQPTQISLTATSIPVNCFGTSTGTINVTGSGGTPTYSYNLNGGAYQASSAFVNQFAGIYTMGIRDVNGCVATQTVQVTQPTALAINVSTQNANCTAANGIASSTVTGGTGTITYTWTGAGGASSVSNGLVGGSYTVTATDGNGCVITSPAVIGITPGGSAAITASSNITCNGANNGSMTAGMTGGASPFAYSWSPGGQTTQLASGLAPGTYTCIITDFFGCIANASATLTQPTLLTAIMNSNNVKCYGTATGTVSAAGTGGTGPYTYLWPTIPSTLATVPNVALGNYNCNITDANGCTITSSITVTQPTSITLTSTVTTANCNQANGSATVIASGGAPGAYTYTWSSGSNAASQSGLLAGTYTIQVQDANNCIEIVSATIPNATGPVISIASQTNVSCFGGCNGVAVVSVSGGVFPYTYSWSNGNVSSIAPNLCAQIYTVSATDDAGCVSSTSVTITQPTALTVGIVSSDPKCFGASNGYGIGAALGGTPNYSYSWSGGGGSSATSNPIGAGGYNLLVTDGNGCTVTSTMTLVNPPAMAASITSTNVSCFGTCNGSAIATSTNGIGAVGYYWVGGASPIASQIAGSLCAGTYTMVATDQNSCTASAIITITEPPVLTANISSTGSVTCNGGNNGFAVVSAGGGTPSYSYTWSGVASASGNSANANTLPAGVYTVTVTDTKSCSVTANATIIEPAPLVTALTFTNAKCNGVCDGEGNVAFSGGAGTTTFLWQPGLQSGNTVNNLCAGNQTVTITSNGACTTVLTFSVTEPALLTAVATATTSNCGQANGRTCAMVGGGTSPLTYLWSNSVNTLCNNNVVAGAYTFTVTDVNGCKAITSGLVNDISGPTVSIATFTDVTCFGLFNGGASATITGGVPNYNISWSGAQSSANTTTATTNFGAGVHNITVTDAAGCVGSASVTIAQPIQLVSAIGSFTNVSCNGLSNGGATILVNGGTTPYNYTWTPGGQTSSVLANVPANTYTASVSDGNGCLASSQVVISQPQALTFATPVVTNISCFGGTNGQISTTVQGGTPGYIYVWNPAQSGNSGVIGSLPAGGYSLTVTDTKNCPITANFTILEPSVLTSPYASTTAKCGLTNGSATVTVGGGTPPYMLNWNTAPAQQGSVASNMAPGSNWQCVITDFNGCSRTQTVNVNSAPSPIFSSPVATQPSCSGLSNGAITVNYTSGTGPYTVIWSSPISQTTTSSALTQSVAGIAQGAYTAILTDMNGCSTSQQISVSQPSKLILIVSPDITICYGESTQLNASGQGGTPAYSYTWTPNTLTGGGPHTVSPTSITSYDVLMSDTKGCTRAEVITINVTPQLSAIGSSVTLCHSASTVLTPTITSPGNGGAYSYIWTPAAPNASSNLVYGSASLAATTVTYGLVISDGCSLPNATTIFTVITNPLPTVTFTASTLEACAPANIDFLATPGAAGNYSYSWISDNNNLMGTTNPVTSNYNVADTFSVKLVITNLVTGCSNTEIKNNYILINKPPVASFYADPLKASILDPNINFFNTSQGATSYYWDFGDPAAINGSNNSMAVNPSHGYSYTGEYAVNLIAMTIKGCKDIAKLLVEITPDFALYIPNAFTPDENGKNDVFQPMGVGIDEENYRMDIFDRWGENIFNSTNFRKGWDGSVKGGSKKAPQGVYVYRLQVTDTQGGKHPYVGHVTVIRKSE